MAVLGLIRSIHAIGIQLAKPKSLNPNMPYVTSPVAHGIQINYPGGNGIFGMIKQLQPNAVGVSAEERKVHTFATCIDPQRQRHSDSNRSQLRYLHYIFMQRAFRRSLVCRSEE